MKNQPESESNRIVTLESTITCSNCGNVSAETMPENSCQFFWQCAACEVVLKPDKGDCCVFCSYGDTPCPPVQQEKNFC